MTLSHIYTDNKLLDMYPKHQLFYMMGGAYGVLFTVMGLLLMHPTIGLQNTQADPSRWLGWVSYVTIEVSLCMTCNSTLCYVVRGIRGINGSTALHSISNIAHRI